MNWCNDRHLEECTESYKICQIRVTRARLDMFKSQPVSPSVTTLASSPAISSSVWLMARSVPAASLSAGLSITLQAANHQCHLNITLRKPYIHIAKLLCSSWVNHYSLPNISAITSSRSAGANQSNMTSVKRQTSAKSHPCAEHDNTAATVTPLFWYCSHDSFDH